MRFRTPHLVVFITLVAIICFTLPAFSQQAKTVTHGPIVIPEFKHDTGPLLREVAPLLPEFSAPSEHEIENNVNPNHNWKQVTTDTVLQRPENGPTTQTPNFNVEFDGLGVSSAFFCRCMPPDNDGAPGTTQYVQYINLSYAVYSKTGSSLLGPVAGNSFWSGFGGSCQTDNSGDPVVRFDAAAQRWVVSQFAINSVAPDYECVAVSQTADATGAWNRYAFPMSNFPDYPKMGVWPDAYYFTFNNFNIAGTAFVGANACAVDRNAMIAGTSATMVCFQQNSSQFGMLPSDLDGATPPAAGTPNFVMELDPSGSANLDLFKFHVDFVTPANSTFTGPTLIPVAAFTPLCNGYVRGRCVPQPTAGSDLLESLGDRLMYRLVYRNFGDHTTLLTTHSILSGTNGGVRWYEIRNPETAPTVFQSGTYAPDTQWRWMPGIAMDQNQDIAVGYSRSGTAAGQYPSIMYAGRVPSDPPGTLESEVLLKAGAGSQVSSYDRWGDYSSVTVDPTDDCTFWFTQEYLQATGGFNWSTAIGSFTFPNCGVTTPDFSLSPNPATVSIAQGNTGSTTITVSPLNGFTASVALIASGLPTGVTAAFNPTSTTTTSSLTFTVSGTAAVGTYPITVTGTSGALTHTTSVSLTLTAAADFSLSPNPASVSVQEGSSGSSVISVTPLNGFTGSVTLVASGAPSGVSAAFNPNPTSGTSLLTLTVGSTVAVGTYPITVTGTSGALTHTTSVSLTVTSATAPAVTITPSSGVWGSILVGNVSGVKSFTVANTGTAVLNIASIVASGDFNLTSGANPCGATLAVGKSCIVRANFAPTQIGARSGAITLTDNAGTGQQTIALSGTGLTPVALTPAAYTFPVQKVGTSSAAKTFTLNNKANPALNSIVIGTTGDFSVSTTTCGSSLAGKTTCTISVVFTPTATGKRTGTLTVTDSSVNSPHTSNLTGTGK